MTRLEKVKVAAWRWSGFAAIIIGAGATAYQVYAGWVGAAIAAVGLFYIGKDLLATAGSLLAFFHQRDAIEAAKARALADVTRHAQANIEREFGGVVKH